MSIEQRLQRLEKQNRYWMLGTVCLAALLLLGASRSVSNTTVQAQKFELVDACGKVRAELLMDNDLPSLVFVTSTGSKANRIGLLSESGEGEGGSITLSNAQTDCTIELRTGTNRAQLWLNGGQNRYINMLTRSHHVQKPIIWLTDETGLRARLSTQPDRGQLQLYDTHDTKTFSVP